MSRMHINELPEPTLSLKRQNISWNYILQMYIKNIYMWMESDDQGSLQGVSDTTFFFNMAINYIIQKG